MRRVGTIREKPFASARKALYRERFSSELRFARNFATFNLPLNVKRRARKKIPPGAHVYICTRAMNSSLRAKRKSRLVRSRDFPELWRRATPRPSTTGFLPLLLRLNYSDTKKEGIRSYYRTGERRCGKMSHIYVIAQQLPTVRYKM